MSYRIAELEKAMEHMKTKMEALTPAEEKKAAEVKKEEEIKMEDVELPKLNGAPVEETATKFSAVSKTDKLKEVNSQNSFLSKLYN
jgi:flagellar hook-length control protein FliK